MNNEVSFKIHFVKGAYLEIIGPKSNTEKYLVQFLDKKTKKIIYENTLKVNTWARPNISYFVDWLVIVKNAKNEIVYTHELNLTGKRVYIAMCSSSLGDTLAWFPIVDEFRKLHNCKIICSTFHNNLFEGMYPDIEFVKPGNTVDSIYAMYEIGWFYEKENVDYNKTPHDFKKYNLQHTATQILGLPFLQQIRPKLNHNVTNIQKKKSVCIAIHSTAQTKYWNNPTGWQEVVDYLNSNGYEVILISKESGTYMGNVPPSGITDKSGDIPLQDRMRDLLECEFFIGIGSGLSWLSWALGTKTVIISGFSEKYSEYCDVRIINENVCHGCFNNYKLDPSDWNWCPSFKNTDNIFICTKKISGNDVINALDKMLNK